MHAKIEVLGLDIVTTARDITDAEGDVTIRVQNV